MTCAICGSDAKAAIHQAEPERGCKRPEEHHEFIEEEDEDEIDPSSSLTRPQP